jgi:hypothetical protein
MAIVEVLRDGRPHPGPDLRTVVEERLGEGCFGAQAEQTLEADIAALRAWSIRIGHSNTLQQTRIGTRSRHSDWDNGRVEAEVRRLVTGGESVME